MKKVILRVLVYLLVACAITACAATKKTALQKELEVGSVPQFDGYISPITSPVLLRYKPDESRFKLEMAMDAKFLPKDDVSEGSPVYATITGSERVEKLGNMLVRDIVISDMVFSVAGVDDTKIPEGIRTMRMRILMDTFGKMQDVQMVGPGNIDQEKQLVEMVKNIAPVLPKKAVLSGDFFPIASDASLEFLISTITPDISPKLTDEMTMKYEHGSIIRGWGVVRGRKVLVVSIDESATGETSVFGARVTVKGYELYDAETMRKVESHALSILTLAIFTDSVPKPVASLKSLMRQVEL